MAINDRMGARLIALRKLGKLFARLDDAYAKGESERAKELIADVRSALNEAQQNELGAHSMHAPRPIEDDSRQNSRVRIRAIAEVEPAPFKRGGHRSR